MSTGRVITGTLIFFAVVGGLYLGFRYWGASTVGGKQFKDDFSLLPPVRCVSVTSHFEGVDVATTTIAKGFVNIDFDYQVRGFSTSREHILITPKKEIYIWIDGESRGTVTRYQQLTENKAAEETLAKSIPPKSVCSPLWSPNMGELAIPSNVTFDRI